MNKLRYYLFGEEAVRRFHNYPDTKDFLRACNGSLDGSVHLVNPKSFTALDDLMEAFNGWHDYAEITMKFYNELNKEFYENNN